MARSVHPHRFLGDDERKKIAAAIHATEAKSSGEIRVHLDKRCRGEPHEAAKRTFEKLGMHATAEKNGVLIWLAIRDRAFAILGDSGIHSKVEPGFWDAVRDRMGKAFAEDRFGDGIAAAIEEIAERLAKAFPHRAGDVDELPDAISEGRG